MATSEKVPAPPDTLALMSRYNSAYSVSNGVVGSGATLKNVGILIMVAGVLGGALLAMAAFDRNSIFREFASFGAAGGVGLGIVGLIWGYSIYARGQLLMALGQASLAMLDTAVSTSPFLENPHRAKILSLPTSAGITYLQEKAKELAAS